MKDTPARQLVMDALRTGQARYGYELMKVTGLQSGTLYPLLARLERENVVRSSWEPSTEPGRPPRKIYLIVTESHVTRPQGDLRLGHLGIPGRGR